MLYKPESTRPSILHLVLNTALSAAVIIYLLIWEGADLFHLFLSVGGILVILGTLYQYYLFLSGKTLSEIETGKESLRITYQNGKQETIPYGDITQALILPSRAGTLGRRYWFLNLSIRGKGRRRRYLNLKLFEGDIAQEISKLINGQ